MYANFGIQNLEIQLLDIAYTAIGEKYSFSYYGSRNSMDCTY